MTVQTTHERRSLDLGISTPRSVGRAILLAALLLISVEAVLQVRSHLRTGRSVWSMITSSSMYVRDAELNIRLLRASAEIGGKASSIKTNRLGLRGEDIPASRPDNELRIAVLGSSTIMSPFAASNDQTAVEILQARLRSELSPRPVAVINAGIGGLKVSEQLVLLEARLLPLDISLLAWYPGMNDISCADPQQAGKGSPKRLPVPELPSWVLSYDLLVKNSTWLRRSRVGSSRKLVPVFDPSRLRSELEEGVRIARSAGIQVVLVTSAASFSPDMDAGELARRAATGLEHRPCYSAEEFAKAVTVFNDVIRDVAFANGIGLVDAAEAIGTEKDLFVDDTHFSLRGEQRLAELLRTAIVSSPADPAGGPRP
jgi:lysophospholipase L1-like esterase